jgi:integrase
MAKARSRIYSRKGTERRSDGTTIRRAPRYYGDFRDYADVGGAREPLIAEGTKGATTDPDIAAKLAADRLAVLDAKRRGRTLHGITTQTTLQALADLHLRAKAASGRFTEGWLASNQHYLTRMLSRLGAARDPASVTVAEIREVIAWLRTVKTNRRVSGTDETVRGTLGEVSLQHHLAALSNLFERAAEQGYVQPGFNPVAALMEKPKGTPTPPAWLEIHDAALLLEAARTYQAPEEGTPFAHPLIATYLLTGGRESEVYGLELDDVSLERLTVTFRPNQWRRLKTKGSARTVPLWPQLEAILREYLKGPHRPTGELLFPSFREEVAADGTTRRVEAILTDCRKLLDRVAARAGWKTGEIRTKMFRHTYTAARLQTTDHGAPVAVYTVSRELGHTSTAMVEKVYSHLGTIRHRAATPEFRIEQHRERLADRLGFVTTGDTTNQTAGQGNRAELL